MSLLNRVWVWIDYEIVLELFSKFPFGVGRFLAGCRGALYYFLKRDWRVFTFGDKELFKRAFEAYGEIYPHLNRKGLNRLVRQRCIYQSIEEYESVCLKNGKLKGVGVKFEGDSSVLKQLGKDSRYVFLTAHFGASIVGVNFLGQLNLKILGMSSNVVEQRLVHRSITKLYKNKYEAIAKELNGGGVVDIEENYKRFFSFLKSEGSLVIVGDLPPRSENENPFWTEFFYRVRGFASGANRFSTRCSSEIIPFVCYYEDGNYVVKFGKISSNPYKFLEDEIKKRAGLWWASDLLSLYLVR